jgi:hypothetical protein
VVTPSFAVRVGADAALKVTFPPVINNEPPLDSLLPVLHRVRSCLVVVLNGLHVAVQGIELGGDGMQAGVQL